jgi:HYR domain
MRTQNFNEVINETAEAPRVAPIRYGALVILIALIAAASFYSPSASTGNVPPFVPTPLGPTDFLVSDLMGSHISVLDQNLVFKGFFDENLMVFSFRGLDFLPNQHIVGLSLTTPPTVTEYDTSGMHISSFMSTDLHGDPIDVKSNKAPLPADFRLYFGQDAGMMANSAPELNLSGTKIRGFGSNFYDGIAVLPGNVMWAGGLGFGSIDVFDISSGSGSGNNIAPTSTITLDNGQVNLFTMTYSAVSNTVLMVEPGSSSVFERMTNGTFVRKFVAPMGISLSPGVTRGPGNDVFASGINGVGNGRIVRWNSTGTFVSTTNISVFDPGNIIWAGNNTAAACTLTCPGNQTANTGPGATMCCAVVNFSDPTTSGTCGTVTCNPPSASCFPVGTTTVTCSETGGANCAFTVTVTDNTPPVITCPANKTAKTATINDPCVAVSFTATASDNCTGVSVGCVPPTGSCFPVGATTVNCTATDASNNTAHCSFSVTVFNVCIQDDSNPSTVFLASATTGAYRFCCGGTTFTGVAQVTRKGNVATFQDNSGGRRVQATDDEAVFKGTASIQSPPGTIKCTITDRDTRNDSCVCQ